MSDSKQVPSIHDHILVFTLRIELEYMWRFASRSLRSEGFFALVNDLGSAAPYPTVDNCSKFVVSAKAPLYCFRRGTMYPSGKAGTGTKSNLHNRYYFKGHLA